jgi:hypothetical protein
MVSNPHTAKFAYDYLTQRDNSLVIQVIDGWVWNYETKKKLFPVSEMDKRESELFDRTTECFISSGSMFAGCLHKAGILATIIDELTYKINVIDHLKRKQTRFFWESHKRVFNEFYLKDSEYEFVYEKVNGNEDKIRASIDAGFVVICSIWIKPWYPSGRGHLIIIKGYVLDQNGNITAWICDDPFGDCLSKYINHNGHDVRYDLKNWRMMMNSPEDKPRLFGYVRKRIK